VAKKPFDPTLKDLMECGPEDWIAMLGLPDLAEELLAGVVSMKESSTYQAILREGRKEGIAEGKAEGMAEGMARGILAEARKLLLLLGEGRFGSPEAQFKSALGNIDDVKRLEAMIARIQNAASWQDLLDVTTPRRRNGRRSKA
jgi:hypothetical protein